VGAKLRNFLFAIPRQWPSPISTYEVTQMSGIAASPFVGCSRAHTSSSICRDRPEGFAWVVDDVLLDDEIKMRIIVRQPQMLTA